MKKLFLGLLTAVLFISACQKDEKQDPGTGSGSFTYEGKTVVTPYGTTFQAVEYAQLTLTDKPFDTVYSGKISIVNIHLFGTIAEGTYTYKSKDSASFDKTKNFVIASLYYDFNTGKSGPSQTTGSVFESDIDTGTVIIQKGGDIYSVNYDIKYRTTKLTGTYTGKLIPLK
jgi:hypothetical protein